MNPIHVSFPNDDFALGFMLSNNGVTIVFSDTEELVNFGQVIIDTVASENVKLSNSKKSTKSDSDK